MPRRSNSDTNVRRRFLNPSELSQSLCHCVVSLAEIAVDEYYPTFLDIVRSLLDGNTDSSSYEDTLREMFGIHAYIAFTLDKVVHNCVRQLQYLVQDETSATVKQLYADELRASNLSGSSLSSSSCNVGSSSILGSASSSAGGGGCGGKVSNMSNVNTINAESVYQKKAETLLHDQNCYKIILVSSACQQPRVESAVLQMVLVRRRIRPRNNV